MGVELPKDWQLCSLPELASYQNGKAFPSKDYSDAGVRLVRPGNLAISGKVTWSEKHSTHLPERYETDNPDYMVGPGEILMNLTAQSLEDGFLGRVCMTQGGTRCLLNQRIARIRPKTGVDNGYLYWALAGPDFRAHVQLAPKGSKIKHLYNRDLDAAMLRLPPLPEQRKIAAILSSVDEAIEKTQAVIDQVQVVKKGLMQELLTRGLPGRHTRFKQTEIGEVPEEWDVAQLRDVAKAFNGKGSKSGGSWLRLYKTKHIYDGDVRQDQPEFVPDERAGKVPKWAYLQVGDVLTPNMAHGTIGRVSFVASVDGPTACDGQVMVIRSNDRSVLDPRFFFEFLSSHVGRQQILDREVGSIFGPARGQTHLYPTDVGSIWLPIPPADEQSEIARLCCTLDVNAATNRARLGPLRDIKKGLMQRLLSGEVRVHVEQDEAA